MEEVNRVTGLVKAVGGLVVGQDTTLDSGVILEIATTSDVLLSGANQVLRFSGGTSYYVGFKAPTTVTSSQTYILPQHDTTPPGLDYVLTYQAGDQLAWKSIGGAGGGDVTQVGDCAGPECFTTVGGGTSNTLWFEGATANDFEIALTAADPGADYTITLPAVTGTVALGTGTTDYVAYWTAENTLAGEEYLANTRGGIGEASDSWSGMVNVVGGNWGAVTGTTGYSAYWSDANTVAAEEYSAVSRGGTGAGTFTQYGVIYGNDTNAFGVTAAGTADYLLVGSGASAPTWKYLAQLLTAGTNIDLTGTTNMTIATVDNPIFSTSVTSPQFLSTTSLAIQSGNGQDITIDSASGKIVLASGDWIETFGGYEIGKADTEILREMIPILGFDLPVQTATTTYVKISRTLESYPFTSAAAGTERIHKLVFRYAASTTAAIDVQVATTSGAYPSFTLPVPTSANLDQGEAHIATTTIPTSTAWWLEVKTTNVPDVTRIFEIFLAAYDQIQ